MLRSWACRDGCCWPSRWCACNRSKSGRCSSSWPRRSYSRRSSYRRRTKINRIAASGTSQFNSLVLSLAALVASISVTYCIAEETINLVFFGVALYALLSGLILIVVRTRIFSHMVGFLVIENGVFLFSMAVGVEMPSMIEIAIMLDILISILMLGLFLTKIGARFRIGDTDLLTNVKD